MSLNVDLGLLLRFKAGHKAIGLNRGAKSESGKTNDSRQLQPRWAAASIEFECWIQSHVMAGITGSPYIDTNLHSQKPPFLNSSFDYNLLLLPSWDWMLADIRYHLFMISHQLGWFKICSGHELLVTEWVTEQRMPFRFYLIKHCRLKSG